MVKAEDRGPGSFVRGPKLSGFITNSILRQFGAHPNSNPLRRKRKKAEREGNNPCLICLGKN